MNRREFARLLAISGMQPESRAVNELLGLSLIERCGGSRLRATRAGQIVLNEVVLRLASALKPGGHEITGETIQEQTEQALANLGAILEAAGSGFDRLVKTTVFLQHLDDFQGMNEVYATKVGDQPPARSTVEVAKLPSGALVEIEAIALI